MFCLPYTFAPQITRNNNMSNSNKTNERNETNRSLFPVPVSVLYRVTSYSMYVCTCIHT